MREVNGSGEGRGWDGGGSNNQLMQKEDVLIFTHCFVVLVVWFRDVGLWIYFPFECQLMRL